MQTHKNVKPKAAWSRLRATWVPGFEQILEAGVAEEWYNPDNIIDK
jgi:hypothetical protein